MATDAPATQEANVLAAMGLTKLSQNIPVSVTGGLSFSKDWCN